MLSADSIVENPKWVILFVCIPGSCPLSDDVLDAAPRRVHKLHGGVVQLSRLVESGERLEHIDLTYDFHSNIPLSSAAAQPLKIQFSLTTCMSLCTDIALIS